MFMFLQKYRSICCNHFYIHNPLSFLHLPNKFHTAFPQCYDFFLFWPFTKTVWSFFSVMEQMNAPKFVTPKSYTFCGLRNFWTLLFSEWAFIMGITVTENDRLIKVEEDELGSKYRCPLNGDVRWRGPRNVRRLAIDQSNILRWIPYLSNSRFLLCLVYCRAKGGWGEEGSNNADIHMSVTTISRARVMCQAPAKPRTSLRLCNIHNPVRQVLLSLTSYRWMNWGFEKLSKCSKFHVSRMARVGFGCLWLEIS